MKTFSSAEGYDLYAPMYKKDHEHLDSFDWDVTRARIVSSLENLVATTQIPPVRVLDLGCGDGRVLKRLTRLCEQKSWESAIELQGWDISDGMLKQARKALPASVILKNRDILQLDDLAENERQLFDLVLSFFVVVHIDDPFLFVTALESLVKPGGVAIFNNIPQQEALVLESGGKKFQIEYEHHRPQELLDAISETGLQLVEHHTGQWSDLFIVEKANKLT